MATDKSSLTYASVPVPFTGQTKTERRILWMRPCVSHKEARLRVVVLVVVVDDELSVWILLLCCCFSFHRAFVACFSRVFCVLHTNTQHPTKRHIKYSHEARAHKQTQNKAATTTTTASKTNNNTVFVRLFSCSLPHCHQKQRQQQQRQ